MNIYDTANRLASEIKQTDEYKAYKNSKQQIESNAEVKSKIDEFDKLRVEAQKAMLKGEANANELSVKLNSRIDKIIFFIFIVFRECKIQNFARLPILLC